MQALRDSPEYKDVIALSETQYRCHRSLLNYNGVVNDDTFPVNVATIQENAEKAVAKLVNTKAYRKLLKPCTRGRDPKLHAVMEFQRLCYEMEMRKLLTYALGVGLAS